MGFPVLIEKDAEAGGYVISCPMLKRCVSQGETKEEAFEKIKEAIQTYFESIQNLNRMNKLKTVEIPAA